VSPPGLSHRNFSQSNPLDGGPDNREATHLGREHVNLVGALAHITEETFDGVGGSNIPVHGLRKLVIRELSPRMVTWRRIAALAGLITQGLVGFVGATFYSFSLPPHFGAGFWLVLLGFMVMIVDTFLNSPRPAWR